MPTSQGAQRMTCPPRCTNGFTLLELLAALTITGVLAGIAVPAYRSARDAGTAANTEARLVSSMSDATRQAVVTGQAVVMCPTIDAASCSDGFEWTRGWIAFTDVDGNRLRSSAESIHLTEGATDHGLALITSTGRRHLRFQPSGAVEGTNLTFTLCDSRGARRAVSWIVGNSGRIRRARASNNAAARCGTFLAGA